MSTVPQLTPAQLETNRTSVRVVDVREPDEVATSRIPGSLIIPLGQLAGRLDELTPDVPIVTVCQSGGRSQAPPTPWPPPVTRWRTSMAA